MKNFFKKKKKTESNEDKGLPWDLTNEEYENKKRFIASIFKNMKEHGVNTYIEGNLLIVMNPEDDSAQKLMEKHMRGFRPHATI